MAPPSHQSNAPQSRSHLKRVALITTVALIAAVGCAALYVFLWLDYVGGAFDAVRDGGCGRLELLLTLRPDLVRDTSRGETLLHAAARQGREPAARLLISRGADVNARDQSSRTPLHCAAQNARTEIAALLLRNGGDIDARNNDGLTALLLAAGGGHRHLVRALLEHGAQTSLRDPDGRTPLDRARAAGSVEAVKLLLERHTPEDPASLAPVFEFALENGGEDSVRTALERHTGAQPARLAPILAVALEHGHETLARFLLGLHRQADPADLAPALELALKRGAKNLVLEFLSIHSRIDKGSRRKGARGATLLHLAVRANNKELVEALVDAGADLDRLDLRKSTPLADAAKRCQGDTDIVKLLLSEGADADGSGLYRALEIMFDAGRKQVVTSYLESTGVINRKRNRAGQTLLHLAVSSANKGMVRLLLDQGANVGARNWRGNRPLHLAATGKRLARELTAMLLERKADPNVEDLYERTVLHAAVMARAKPEVVKLLLDAGAKIEARCIDKYTPLLLAAKAGDLPLVKLLVQYKAKIDSTDRNRQTSLHYAAKYGHLEIARFLLASGAYYRANDNSGARPIRLAIRHDRHAIRELLQEHGEKLRKKREKEARERQQKQGAKK